MVIIGAGRVGTALADMGGTVPVRRGQPLPDTAGPIIVCTRNDDLAGVIDTIPAHRRGDLVFVQNGMLSTWLAERGLSESTQALLYFAVSAVGDAPVDGGRTVVTGPHAAALCALLAAGGIAARTVSRAEFRDEMVEKFLWNCTFGLLCQRHGATVGAVVEQHHDALTALTAELLGICDRALGGVGLTVDPLVERLCDYSRSIADYRGAVKEWPWRNGWLVDQERTPLHMALLAAVGLP
jgi:ketopantoate reductase